MTKHHLVQIAPVANKDTFWVKLREEAGRNIFSTPARTMAHFMTGAQKCTVLIPTSEFHILFKYDSGAAVSAVAACWASAVAYRLVRWFRRMVVLLRNEVWEERVIWLKNRRPTREDGMMDRVGNKRSRPIGVVTALWYVWYSQW